MEHDFHRPHFRWYAPGAAVFRVFDNNLLAFININRYEVDDWVQSGGSADSSSQPESDN